MLTIVLIPLACIIAVESVSRVLLIGTLLLGIIVELLDSSIEAAVDRIGFDTHRLSKRAKHLGRAAVLVALILLVATWLLLAAPALAEALNGLIRPLRTP